MARDGGHAGGRLPRRRPAKKRVVGFWTFILSNVLWIVWGVHDGAWALIALQAGLAAMNVRAIVRNERGDPADEKPALSRHSRESGNPY
jgi:hypothetical protein